MLWKGFHHFSHQTMNQRNNYEKNVSDRIVFAFHAIMLHCRIVCKSHFPIGRRRDDENDVGDNYDVDSGGNENDDGDNDDDVESGGNENDDGDDNNYETRWI